LKGIPVRGSVVTGEASDPLGLSNSWMFVESALAVTVLLTLSKFWKKTILIIKSKINQMFSQHEKFWLSSACVSFSTPAVLSPFDRGEQFLQLIVSFLPLLLCM